jgi:hypothetical protein
MEATALKVVAAVLETHGLVGGLIVTLLLLLAYGAWKCSADAKKRDALAREDMLSTIGVIEKNTEMMRQSNERERKQTELLIAIDARLGRRG